MGILDIALAPRIAPTAAKAEVGPFVSNIVSYPQASLFNTSRQPNRVMAEAQAIYKRNAWVAAAERAIVGRIMQTGWRIEDADGQTITPQTHPAAAELLGALGDLGPIGGPVSVTQAATSTRRGLWSLTLRHCGLCGTTFWLKDEMELLTGTPRRMLYLNPVRMTPATTHEGLLVGWFLDHPDNPMTPRDAQTIPLTLEEVQQFTLDPDDESPFGVGIAEAAADQIGLNRLASGHASSTLGLGGRLTGIVSPPASATVEVSEEKWESVVRDWRNLANDPNSAKRLQVIRAPVEFTQLAASPTDLQLADLLSASKEDIFAAWGVPISQVGMATAAGLNSGQARADDAEVLWEGACSPRLDAFRDGLQAVLNLWSARLGFHPAVVFDVPSFDDDAPAYTVAEQGKVLPLTNNERRAVIGLDPFEDEVFGNQVWIDKSMVPVGQSAEDAAPGAGELTESASAGKADTTLRNRVETRWLADIRRTVTALLVEQRDAIATAVEQRWEAISRKPGDETAWWRARWDTEWDEALAPLYRGLADQTTSGARAMVGKADPLDDVVEAVVRNGGARIGGITATTRKAVSAIIRQGIADGWGPAEVATHLRDDAAFGESRSELIARTETMNAYNEASLGTYGRLGVEYVDALDGDADDECANRVAANPWRVSDAYGQQDHPNGTLDWAPVVEPVTAGRATVVEQPPGPGMFAALQAAIAAADRPVAIPAPIVTVSAPPAPVVDMAPIAAAIVDLRELLTAPKSPMRRVLERDADGRIVAMTEVPQ